MFNLERRLRPLALWMTLAGRRNTVTTNTPDDYRVIRVQSRKNDKTGSNILQAPSRATTSVVVVDSFFVVSAPPHRTWRYPCLKALNVPRPSKARVVVRVAGISVFESTVHDKLTHAVKSLVDQNKTSGRQRLPDAPKERFVRHLSISALVEVLQ